MLTGFFTNHVRDKENHHAIALASEEDERERAQNLQQAQDKAVLLFADIERDLIKPGVSEEALSNEIWDLAKAKGHTDKKWHKNVVRSGPNTLKPYSDDITDRVIGEDDILFIDLGPVFEQWEADFGRTYVTGSDPAKIKLRHTLEPLWLKGKQHFDTNPNITGEELYKYVCSLAKEAGYEFGGVHSGHLVGDFPHERIPNDKVRLYITEGNTEKLRGIGHAGTKHEGKQRHWILEMHLVDRERQIGGFYEQLLSVG